MSNSQPAGVVSSYISRLYETERRTQQISGFLAPPLVGPCVSALLAGYNGMYTFERCSGVWQFFVFSLLTTAILTGFCLWLPRYYSSDLERHIQNNLDIGGIFDLIISLGMTKKRLRNLIINYDAYCRLKHCPSLPTDISFIYMVAWIFSVLGFFGGIAALENGLSATDSLTSLAFGISLISMTVLAAIEQMKRYIIIKKLTELCTIKNLL